MENVFACFKDEKGNIWIRKDIGNGEVLEEMIYENKDFIMENYFKKEDNNETRN